jgi:ubiquinone/menaquinone biosynthesis C-methylase UbiE
MEFTAEQSATDELEQRPDEAEADSDNEDNSNARFGKVDYWNKRFENEEVYDWLVEYEHVAKDILPLLQTSDRILIVGCGNSTFSRRLYDAGYENIVNIDYSAVVIERMREANCDVSMQWLTMDMRELDFPSQSFDVVIDKAAMDALVVEEGDVWDPHTEVIQSTHKNCLETQRVLTETGTFLMISFAQPHFRTKYLMGYRAAGVEVGAFQSHQGWSEVYGWTLRFKAINKGSGCLDSFLYTMVKSAPPVAVVESTDITDSMA